MRRAILVGVLAAALSGCLATPLAHPLRATNGLTAEGSLTGGIFSGNDTECGPPTCNHSSGSVGGVVSGSLGYSHVFARRFGAMVGAYGPAVENLKNHSALSAVAAYSFFTFQTRILSAGMGPEVGWGGGSFTMGLELGPFPRPRDGLSFGGYARWFWPFVPAGNAPFDDHRNHEFGIRVRRSFLYFQYGFTQQVAGLREFDYFGTTVSTRAYHQLTLGVQLDASTVPWGRGGTR